MNKSEFSGDLQEQHTSNDTNQIKRQILKLEKEQQGISKLTQDFKNTSKKVIENLENDSQYYVSHLKDIEYTTKIAEKEMAVKEEQGKAAEGIYVKLKESKNVHSALIQEQQELVKDTLSIEIKPKNFDVEINDAEVSFEKYTTRYNNYHNVNAFLREKVQGLVKEKVLFEDQNHRYLVELKSLKSKISQSIDGCNQNYEIREELKLKVVQLLEKNEKEKSLFQTEMLELERLINEKQEDRSFKENKQQIRGFIQIETQSKSDLKKEKDVQLLKELEEFVAYLETFQDFKNSFVKTYESKEREIKSLLEFTCEKFSFVKENTHYASVRLEPQDLAPISLGNAAVPLQQMKEKVQILSEQALTGLNDCANLLNLELKLQEENDADYFTSNTINPQTYYSEIDYQLDKLTLLAALKKAVLDTGDDVLGSFRHNSTSTLSSEKPNATKERLIIINPSFLEPPHFVNKPFPTVEYFNLI